MTALCALCGVPIPEGSSALVLDCGPEIGRLLAGSQRCAELAQRCEGLFWKLPRSAPLRNIIQAAYRSLN